MKISMQSLTYYDHPNLKRVINEKCLIEKECYRFFFSAGGGEEICCRYLKKKESNMFPSAFEIEDEEYIVCSLSNAAKFILEE